MESFGLEMLIWKNYNVKNENFTELFHKILWINNKTNNAFAILIHTLVLFSNLSITFFGFCCCCFLIVFCILYLYFLSYIYIIFILYLLIFLMKLCNNTCIITCFCTGAIKSIEIESYQMY